MRRVLALTAAICLSIGILTCAHAAITDLEDDLTVTPVETYGDITPLLGRTVTVDITCGDHLVWHTGYTFGADTTETEFEFIQTVDNSNTGSSYSHSFEVSMSGGWGASTSGSFSLTAYPGFSEMINTVAAATQNGSSRSMNLKLSDYMDYYMLGYTVLYEDEELCCNEHLYTTDLILGDFYSDSLRAQYRRFMEYFKFPVQEDTIVEVIIGKDAAGSINDISYNPANAPQAALMGDVSAAGVWFVPVFCTEDGEPLEAELPDGMGIYFVPWKATGTTQVYDDHTKNNVSKTQVTPDVENAVNVYPIAQEISVLRLQALENELWLLTQEDGMYVLRCVSMEDWSEIANFPVLEADPEGSVRWDFSGGYMMVATNQEVVLVDLASHAAVLTAPTQEASTWVYYYWDGDFDLLEYDGEYLTLVSCPYYDDGVFWTAVLRQGEMVFFGRYDCAIFLGNEPWYYNSIYSRYSPITLE